MAPSGSGRAVGLFGLHSQTTGGVRSRPRGLPRRPSRSPAAAPSRGTAMTVAPRCSVMTRYIA